MKTIAKILNYAYITFLCVACMAFVAPCALIFSQGINGEITWWNFAGLIWCWVVYKVIMLISRTQSS